MVTSIENGRKSIRDAGTNHYDTDQDKDEREAAPLGCEDA